MDPEDTIITDEEYEEIIERLAKIGKKISILMMNWSAELQETHNEQDKEEVDIYYQSYLDKYIKKRRRYKYEIEKYEVFTRNMQFTEEIRHLQRNLNGIPRIPTPPLEPSQRSETSTTTMSGMELNYSQSPSIQATRTSTGVTATAGFSRPSVSYSMLPKDGAIRASLAHSPGGLVPHQIPSIPNISPTPQGEDGDIIETGQFRVATPSVPVTRPHTSHGTYTVVSTVTPVTREASRQDALDTAHRLLRSLDGTITSTQKPTDYISGSE